MSDIPWLVLLQHTCIVIAWFVALVYLISGLQDIIYDIGSYVLRLYRRIHFAKRERLSLAKLRSREQQRIAIFIAAWNESEVIGTMVENLLQRVEYVNYMVFVGTYPNDPATQRAVDEVALAHPQVVKVVTARPGPTNKADCMNNIFKAMEEFERANDVNFDLMVMHDAEDVVHPFSLMLYNYLIPRVDVVQLPILPLPVSLFKWTHWVYADEFAENHMKDMPMREKLGGFVPYAGVGTGFSRRALSVMRDLGGGNLFNEVTMTEDYSLSKKTNDLELRSIFVNLLLKDDHSRWYTPLCKRQSFIANWSYFPQNFTRSVRQKTRWITGISLQEWELSGWKGGIFVKENLIRDRKVFLSALTNLLGYLLLFYFVVYELGNRGYVPFRLLPIISEGTPLYTVVLMDTGLMLIRMLERVAFVGMVYGLAAGLASVPRIFYANVLNGIAAFRSLFLYFKARYVRQGLTWDKTDHHEGVGDLPSTDSVFTTAPRHRVLLSVEELSVMLGSTDISVITNALESIPRELGEPTRAPIVAQLQLLGEQESHQVRAILARVCGHLRWRELSTLTLDLLFDPEWVVRSNAARALLKYPDVAEQVLKVFQRKDRYTWEVLTRVIEGDERVQCALFPRLEEELMCPVCTELLAASPLLSLRYERWLKAACNDEGRIRVTPIGDRAAE